MNVLVTFESTSLFHGLSKYDDHNTVKVAIGLVLQWLLRAVHAKATPEQVIDRVNMAVAETFVYAEYMLGDNSLIDNATGQSTRYPLIHSEDKNYSFGEYSTAHSSLYCRYSEIVEHVVLSYTRPVMGFLKTLESDMHATNIQCLEYTDRYIAAVVHCRNLIEYNHE